MSKPTPAEPLLDEAHAAFLQQEVAINLASCDGQHRPSLARGCGCRVSADRRAVTVFVPATMAHDLLRDVRAGGPLAVVFTLPRTHQALQLKGQGAAVVPLADGDRELMRAAARAFSGELKGLGYREPFATTNLLLAEGEAVGLHFEPSAAFVQTPGPKAGTPLATPA